MSDKLQLINCSDYIKLLAEEQQIRVSVVPYSYSEQFLFCDGSLLLCHVAMLCITHTDICNLTGLCGKQDERLSYLEDLLGPL